MKLKLKELLESKDKSVYWLKHETNISHATIYKMVNNETKMISFENLENVFEIWYIYSILNRMDVRYGERKQETGSCSLA